MCWLASHGRKPGKQDLAAFSIPEAAKLIQEPDVPLSLRTQAYLASGLIVILNLKTIHLLQDATLARSRLDKCGTGEAADQPRRTKPAIKKAPAPADGLNHARRGDITMRDRSIPWLLEGLGLAGGLGMDEGASLLHGLHDSEPITVLGSLHTTSDGLAGGGSGGLPGSPDFGGGMYAAVDGDVLTGSLPFGPLGRPGRLRGDPSATGTASDPFAFPPLASPPGGPAPRPQLPSSSSGLDSCFEAELDLEGLPLLDDLPPMRAPPPLRGSSGPLSSTLSGAETAKTDTTASRGHPAVTSPTRSHSALTPALGSHSQVSPDTESESVRHMAQSPRVATAEGGLSVPPTGAGDGFGGDAAAAGGGGHEPGFGFGDWGPLTQGGGVLSPGTQDGAAADGVTDVLAQLLHGCAGATAARGRAAVGPCVPRAPRPRRGTVQKRRLFRDVERITIPSAEFREQITKPQNSVALPSLVAAALEAQRMPEAVDEDALDAALAWRRLPHWNCLPHATRAFVLSRGHLFDHWRSAAVDAVGESGKDASSDDNHMPAPSAQPPAPALSSPTFSSSPPHPPFTTMPAGIHAAADAAAGTLNTQRRERAAQALVADPADIDLPDSGGRARVGVFASQWQEELRLRQLLRTGARPFAGGPSGSEGEDLPPALLRGLATREFSVEELRALGSNHGNSSSAGTPAMERLRALASSGSLVDALGNAVTAEQLWGKRRRGPESLSDVSRDGSDDSLGAPGRSPPLLGPIRVLPTLREDGEDATTHDMPMHDGPFGAPSPPPLPLPLPSPPQLPLLDAPDSSGGGAPEPAPQALGFGSEAFLTQRVPLRPSQVVTEQTTVVHAWLKEERARQHGKRRRLGSGGAETGLADRAEVSLLAGAAALSRSDAAKAFYQALVLQSCQLAELRQEAPFGDITVALPA